MPDDRRRLEDEIRRLTLGLKALEGRVAHLEQGEGAPAPSSESAIGPVEESLPQPDVMLAGFSRSIQYIGRLFLVLGGAYLLRSLTEQGGVPLGVGVGLGLLYGLVWIGFAARAASRGNAYAAAWHAVAATMITLPMIWETSDRYDIVQGVSAVMLGASVLFALAVGWRYRLSGLAWLFVAGAGPCAFYLLIAGEGSGAPIAATMTIIGGVTLWAGRQRGWPGLIFVSALFADLTVLVFVGRTLAAEGPVPLPTLAVPFLLFVVYAGSISVYLLRGWWRLDLLDVLQTAVVLGLGFGAALRMARTIDAVAVPLGIATLVAAVGVYLSAFAVLDRGRRRCFYYLTSIALVLVLVGSASLLDAPALPWSLLAVATAVVGRRFGRVSLTLHAMLYIAAAVAASGLFERAAGGWIPWTSEVTEPLTAVGWLVLAALVACVALPARGAVSVGGGIRRVPHFVTLAVFTWTVGGLLLWFVAASVSYDAWLATARTGLIAAIALSAAAIAQLPHFSTARFLVYPLLAAGALKLLLEDLPSGVPASLAISFLSYGAGLIVAHRLVRTATRGAADSSPEIPAPPVDDPTPREP